MKLRDLYRARRQRGMRPEARARIARSLAEAERQCVDAPRDRRGSGHGIRLVAACVLVALVSHLLTRWTIERPAMLPTVPAALEPVSVTVPADLFPRPTYPRISAWHDAAPKVSEP